MKSEVSYYDQQAIDFLESTKTKFSAVFEKHAPYFYGDIESRDIYKCILQNNRGQYTFTFGQSISNQGTRPSEYDVLAALIKHDPGSFENFCSDYGYDTNSREAKKFYPRVVKEWKGISSIYTEQELEKLQEIQ